MASKTANDMVQAAARNIKYIAYDETLAGNEYDIALGEYKSAHERLKTDAIHQYDSKRVYWAYDNVPEEVWSLVASIAAVDLLKHFSVSEQARANAVHYGGEAHKSLMKYLAKGRSKQNRYPAFPV